MPFHKYKIGQRVIYRPSRSRFPIQCVVTALLPERASDDEFNRADEAFGTRSVQSWPRRENTRTRSPSRRQ
jgi:hypothetical protein